MCQAGGRWSGVETAALPLFTAVLTATKRLRDRIETDAKSYRAAVMQRSVPIRHGAGMNVHCGLTGRTRKMNKNVLNLAPIVDAVNVVSG